MDGGKGRGVRVRRALHMLLMSDAGGRGGEEVGLGS